MTFRPLAAVRLGLALLCAAAAAFLVLTWTEGRRVWPEAPGTPPSKIATPVAGVQSRLDARAHGTPLRVALVGDVQNGTPELRMLLDEVVRQRPDLVIVLGDTVNAGLPGRYAALRDVFRERGAGLPVLAVPGNHDLLPHGRLDPYLEWVGPAAWRIDCGGWAILGLDDANGRFSEESLDLVRALGTAAPARGWVLISHRPVASNSREDGERARAAQLRRAAPVPPALVASGHVHADEDFSDAAGTRHFLFSTNCDRESHGPSSPSVDLAMLTLGDGAPAIERHSVPRVAPAWDELRRVASADVWPVFRETPWAIAAAAGALLAAAALLVPRRAPAPTVAA